MSALFYNPFTMSSIQHNMGDREMLERFQEQLEDKYVEIQEAKDARKVLKDSMREKYEEIEGSIEQFRVESIASEKEIREIDHDIEQMYEEVNRIYADIDSLQGT